jgi:hypothetical protein
MKTLSICCVLVLLAGCASGPPPAPACRGEFRPVNQPARHAAVTLGAGERMALCPALTNGGQHG